jgi:hypothetical protein
MTNQLAIIVGALIIGTAIFGSEFIGRYEIAAVGNPAGPPIVWRINSRSGEIEICSFSPNADDPMEAIARNGQRTLYLKCGSSLGGVTPP